MWFGFNFEIFLFDSVFDCSNGKVKMKNGKIFILKQLSSQASLKDKILIYILKDYTYRIYMKGAKKGFDWHL